MLKIVEEDIDMKVIAHICFWILIIFIFMNFKILDVYDIELPSVDPEPTEVNESIDQLYFFAESFSEKITDVAIKINSSIKTVEDATIIEKIEEVEVAVEETVNVDTYIEPTTEPIVESVTIAPVYDKTWDDKDYPNFYGRLYIPSASIDVALYFGIENCQAVTDRSDSAAIFYIGDSKGLTIADHNYDGFSNLFGHNAGITGYIVLDNNDIVNIECIWAGYGHNTGSHITYDDGSYVMTGFDYMTYTCADGWQNVGIWLWKII